MDVRTIRNYANKAAEIGISLMDEVNFYIVSPRITIGKFPINIPFCLPYNPEKVTISAGGRHRTVDIVGLGEIILTENPHLQEISFESFFPEKDYMLHLNKLGSWLKPKLWIEAFELAMEMREPLRLVITGIGYNSLVVIKDFKYDHHGGTYEDKYYSIVFQQYRDYNAKIINSQNKSIPEDLKPSQESQVMQDRAGTDLGKAQQGGKIEVKGGKTYTEAPVQMTGNAVVVDDLSDPFSKFDAANNKKLYSEKDGIPVKGYDGVVFSVDKESGKALVYNEQKNTLFDVDLDNIGVID